MYFKKLIGQKVYLSPYTVDDAEKWAEWFNDLQTTLLLGDEVYTPTSVEAEREFITQSLKKPNHFFGIIEKDTDQAIGRIGLFNINMVDRHAMVGIIIGEKNFWGKGFGQDSMSLILDYAFNILNLNNVMLGTFEFNRRSMACFKKVGFKEMGRRRQARIIAGKKYDVIMMDILAEEFKSVLVKNVMEKIIPP